MLNYKMSCISCLCTCRATFNEIIFVIRHSQEVLSGLNYCDYASCISDQVENNRGKYHSLNPSSISEVSVPVMSPEEHRNELRSADLPPAEAAAPEHGSPPSLVTPPLP